jgi:antitoxin YefM
VGVLYSLATCEVLPSIVQLVVHITWLAIMDTITYSEARSKLAKTMEKVCDDHSPVIITRKNSRSVVMLSLDDYEALEETTYLLRSPKNARRLLESIAELETSGGTERALTE